MNINFPPKNVTGNVIIPLTYQKGNYIILYQCFTTLESVATIYFGHCYSE